MWSIVRYKEEPMTIRDANLTTAIRAMIREEIFSEFQAREKSPSVCKDKHFSDDEKEEIRNIVLETIDGYVTFEVEVHT